MLGKWRRFSQTRTHRLIDTSSPQPCESTACATRLLLRSVG
jgi:hypothetical protein